MLEEYPEASQAVLDEEEAIRRDDCDRVDEFALRILARR